MWYRLILKCPLCGLLLDSGGLQVSDTDKLRVTGYCFRCSAHFGKEGTPAELVKACETTLLLEITKEEIDEKDRKLTDFGM